MKFDYRKEVILRIVNKKEDLGKTAVMKMVFILQRVFKMKLGYKFDIYTYGPYAAEVSGDLGILTYEGFVNENVYEYGKFSGYELSLSERGKSLDVELSPEDEKNINRVIELFGDKRAKDLELDSTIIYIRDLNIKNKWSASKEDIVDDVHEIKPHFDASEIAEAYDNLEKDGMLV